MSYLLVLFNQKTPTPSSGVAGVIGSSGSTGVSDQSQFISPGEKTEVSFSKGIESDFTGTGAVGARKDHGPTGEPPTGLYSYESHEETPYDREIREAKEVEKSTTEKLDKPFKWTTSI